MTEIYFEILRSGINTTVQDYGRNHLYHIGITVSGVMDLRNHKLANALVLNKNDEASIEFAYQGPLLKLKNGKIIFSITGNVTFNIIRKNSTIEVGKCYQSYILENDEQLDILSTNKSVYGYLAVSGGFNVELFWNSSSTNTKSRIGGNNGQKFNKGDIVQNLKKQKIHQLKKLNYFNSRIEQIRIIKGTNYNYFSEAGKKIFLEKIFSVSKLTDRMGMRLEGPKIENIVDTNIRSEGLIKGVIQVPPDGKPIIMLSDHGTIGGYPKIGSVISADYDKLVQLPAGSKIKFREVSLFEAENLYKIYSMETQNILKQIR